MSDLYYYGQQAMLKRGTKATPIPKEAADHIERLEAVVDALRVYADARTDERSSNTDAAKAYVKLMAALNGEHGD